MAEKTVTQNVILVERNVAQRLSNRVYLSRYLCPECGNEKLARAVDSKKSSVCIKCFNKKPRKHGYSKKNDRHPLYIKWEHMKQRCNDKNHTSYKNYGGRGITVCKEWQTFEGFIKWDGIKDWRPGLQIDRIDVNSGYSPDNCRWVTVRENSQNRTSNVLNPLMVKTIRRLKETGKFSNAEIARIFKCSSTTIWNVVNNVFWPNV